MLWYKYWLDTRWVFLLMVALLSVLSAITVLRQPSTAEWLTSIQRHGHFTQAPPQITRRLDTYEGYVWARWFREELLSTWPGVAMMMGVLLIVFIVSLESFSPCGTAMAYTLSLPVTRRRLVTVGAGLFSVELALVSLVPSLLVPALSPLKGQSYPVTDALIYALLMSVGGIVLFSLSFLLTSILKNGWVVLFGGPVLHFILQKSSRGMTDAPWWGCPYRVMCGEGYFLNGEIPWIGLLVSVALAVVMFYLAIRLFERADF
jgi:hypothetical protein